MRYSLVFNSYQFIFVFLPLVVASFFFMGRFSRTWALRWVIAASLVFYALWRPFNVLIITPSVFINFLLARLLLQLRKRDKRIGARTVLLVGIAFNVAFLGYFKYANFLVGSINDAFGTTMMLSRIILPLGISFITFQKIAFLIDVHAGRVESFTLQDYCLFVLFFPQLIAGPIVHYREMMPQFHAISCRFDKEDTAVGLTLLAFGLFKKVFLADKIALLVTPIYEQARFGAHTALVPAWIAALGFTLQIYFDFSGYTDMALGIARLFGIKLPPNFNSPLRATNIIDFWLRWHMTLTRFLTAYIYNPLTLWLTRRRAVKGLPRFSLRNMGPRAFIEFLMFPVLLTMLISGIWHGAGYTFIVWGVLHGFFLVINHAWRIAEPRSWRDNPRYLSLARGAGFLITFTCVTASMVIFRSANLKTAADLLQGLAGLHHGVGVRGIGIKHVALWLGAGSFVALACPNTLQILSRYEPALGWRPTPEQASPLAARLLWKPSFAWAVAVAAVVGLGILNLGGQSEFLYWQF